MKREVVEFGALGVPRASSEERNSSPTYQAGSLDA